MNSERVPPRGQPCIAVGICPELWKLVVLSGSAALSHQ